MSIVYNQIYSESFIAKYFAYITKLKSSIIARETASEYPNPRGRWENEKALGTLCTCFDVKLDGAPQKSVDSLYLYKSVN